MENINFKKIWKNFGVLELRKFWKFSNERYFKLIEEKHEGGSEENFGDSGQIKKTKFLNK